MHSDALQLPSQSPDVNPIENLFKDLSFLSLGNNFSVEMYKTGRDTSKHLASEKFVTYLKYRLRQADYKGRLTFSYFPPRHNYAHFWLDLSPGVPVKYITVCDIDMFASCCFHSVFVNVYLWGVSFPFSDCFNRNLMERRCFKRSRVSLISSA